MNDQNILKARSVELAERAKRLRDRATDETRQQQLDDCLDELINLDNEARFETAQSALERSSVWAEDQRSLAHEINLAQLSLEGAQPVTFDDTLKILDQWAHLYGKSEHQEIRAAGDNLTAVLTQLSDVTFEGSQKNALNYLLEFFETMLAHLESKEEPANDNMIRTVRLLRSMRDAVLVARELMVDDQELLETDQAENREFDRLTAAREALDEIYASITPTTLPQ